VIVAAVESQEFTSRFRYLSETLAAELPSPAFL
jgi:hypothetical protein